MAGGCHPVRRELDPVQRFQRRGDQVGNRLADRHPRACRGIEQGQRGALADAHRLAGEAVEAAEGDRAVGHRQLPRTDHLVAGGQPADRAVADRDQEGFRRHARMREHAQAGVAQVERVGVGFRPARRRRMRGVAMHLRRLAEQHVHRQVDRRRFAGITDHQAFFRGGGADHREHAAFARAQRGEFLDPRRWDAEHVAFLRFVAPQLHRRQRRIVLRHLAKVDGAADAGIVQQFRDRVGQAAGTDVVHGHDRVVVAHRHAAVDDFLRAPLHLRVVALHRGEIELLAGVARRHRAGGAAAEADQHRRAAEHDDRVARRQHALGDHRPVHRTDAAGEHDRLVVGPGQPLGLVQFEAAEIAGEVGPAEFVVERGGAERAVEHDLEGAGHARVERARAFPRLRQRGDAQVADRESAQARLRATAAAGRALVADLAAGTGGRAGEWRDRGRVVVGFDLDAERAVGDRLAAVLLARRIGTEARGRIAFDHRGVVAVRGQGVFRRHRVGVLDHLEQRGGLLAPIDGPAGVEDLVPAVLGIGLREHHQLDVVRVAAEFAVAFAQVVDLVLRQGEAKAHVGGFQLRQRDDLQRTARMRTEQRRALVARGEQRLGHRVVQQFRQRSLGGRVVGPAEQVDAHAALDPLDRQAGAAQQLGGLARPRRQRAQPRHHEAADRCGFGIGEAIIRLQDALERLAVRGGAGFGIDPVAVAGIDDTQRGRDGVEAGLQAVATERRQGGGALEDDHVRDTHLGRVGTGRPL